MNRFIGVALIVGSSLALLQGCFVLAGAATGAAGKNIDPKSPKAETAANCQSWECWNGYACGPCEESAATEQTATPKK